MALLAQSTKIWRLRYDPKRSFTDYLDHRHIVEAAKALSAGHLVAFPTETVYGLGANAFSESASSKIFVAKGRPSDNPLIVHISERHQLADWILSGAATPEQRAQRIDPLLTALMDAFWPGPLSIIFEYECSDGDALDDSKAVICRKVRGDGRLRSVAVRMPSHPVARALISSAGCPVAAPSANTSGRPSPTNGQHVAHDLEGAIFGILDCGETMCCDVGLESTVIKLDRSRSGKRVVILRPGGVTKEAMDRVLQPQFEGVAVVDCKEVVAERRQHQNGGQHIVEAPGMKYRHYAPRKPLYLVADRGLFADVHWYFKLKGQLENVAFIVTAQNALASATSTAGNVVVIGDGDDLSGIAANLFAVLRRIDDGEQYQRIKVIFSECFEERGIGVAVMNRLQKAAQQNRLIEGIADLQSITLQ